MYIYIYICIHVFVSDTDSSSKRSASQGSRLRATVESLENMKAVREVLGVMRVEGAGA